MSQRIIHSVNKDFYSGKIIGFPLSILLVFLCISQSIKAQNPTQPEEETFIKAEEMPRFPGCEDKISLSQKEDCAKSKLLDFVYGNLVYPLEAQEKKIEGTVVLQFVIKEDGTIDDIRIVRDIGHGCGEAAKKVVESMMQLPERWVPGRNRGNNVNCQFTLPIKFSL
jgi:protein TonB